MPANNTNRSSAGALRLAAAIVACGLAMLVSTLSVAQGYDELAAAMKARQQALAPYLMGSERCLGERQDGFLEINMSCPPEAVILGQEENRNRRDLYALMAPGLGLTSDGVGAERARREADRYKRGVLRQISVNGALTWWDGVPPRPGETDVSRVLAQRYAVVRQSPDAASPVARDNVQQYESFGVFESTTDAQGKRWYRITDAYVPKLKPPGWSPNALGWIAEDEVIPWRRALVMQFTAPYRRDPSLFFKDKGTLVELARLPTTARETRLASMRDAAQEGRGTSQGVLAMEPTLARDMPDAVLYPVLDFYPAANDRSFEIDGKFARLLEIAAQTTENSGPKGSGSAGGPEIDIMFVMDTTQSMGPYLADALAAAESFVQSKQDPAIRYGFIGYRDTTQGFEYAVKEYTPALQTADAFVQTLKGIRAEKAATPGDDIPEAVFQGLDKALESVQWRSDAIKTIWLVGDAPGREDAVTVRGLRDKAKVRGIAVYAFHIANSKVSAHFDHQAQSQYKQLASVYQGAYGTSAETTYFQRVDAQSRQSFRKLVLEGFTQATKTVDGLRECLRQGLNVEACRQRGDVLPPVAEGSFADLIFRQASLVLADRTMPQENIRAWVSDKVLTNPGLEALAPMILLTESELEELANRVRELKDVGEKALIGEGGTTIDFFDLVRQNSRWTMVNPTGVQFRDVFSVPLGIDELPYESIVMGQDREEFQNRDRVQDLVRAMDNKLVHYEDLMRRRGDPAVWKRLSLGADDRDRVVALELDQLP